MGYRSDMDSATGLVDTMIGSAYPVVREVATNIEYVKHVSAHLEEVVNVSDNMENVITIIPELDDVNTVATNIGSVVIVADNMPIVVNIHENMDLLVGVESSIPIIEQGVEDATAAAAEAEADRILAETAKNQAELAETNAEAAATASFALGPKYTTEALGRAAVADGAVFLVQGSGYTAAFEYRRVSASVSTLIATYPMQALVEEMTGPVIETIGRRDFPVTGSNPTDLTIVFANPIQSNGILKRIRFFAFTGVTSVAVRIFRHSSAATLTQVGSDITLAVTAPPNGYEFSSDAGHFTATPVLAGDYIGFYSTGGRILYTPATPPTANRYFSPPANTSGSFIPGATVSAALWQFGVDIVASDLLTRKEVEAIDHRTQQLGNFATQTLGRSVTPVDAVNSANATFVYVDPILEDGTIKALRVWSRGAGTLTINLMEKIGTMVRAVVMPVVLTLVDGLNQLSVADGTMPLIPVLKGQRIGFYMGARLATTAATTGDSGGIYIGSVDSMAFAHGNPFTASRVEIGFDIEYFNVTAVKMQVLTQVAYDAIVTKDSKTLYAIV